MKLADRVSYVGLLVLVLLAPLPLGSNRAWSWSLCAFLVGLLALIWVLSRLRGNLPIFSRLHPAIPVLFALAWAWAWLQQAGWTPASWHHPLWSMVAASLGVGSSGRITLSPDETRTALMRLSSYALVFFLALQFGRERLRAQAMFGWVALGGLLYSIFSLAVYWGGHHPGWLFGEGLLAHDVRGTFFNRNHYATWQGLTVLCTIAWFYHRVMKPEVRPYALPQDREAKVEAFILKIWKPMTALLLMVTALVLTHSRGGFVATLAGAVVLVALLDRRTVAKDTLSRVAVGTALVVASIAFYLTSELLLDRINRTDITTEARMEVFGNVQRAIGDNPVLGFGYGTFADSFRLYDQVEDTVQYDRAHNTWLENAFELGLPAALALYLSLGGLVLTCWRGVGRRYRDWVFPATGVAASVLVGVHAMVDFSLQLPAVAMLYSLVMGVACAQSYSSLSNHA